MLKHAFVLGLVVVGVLLASPCHAELIDSTADVITIHRKILRWKPC